MERLKFLAQISQQDILLACCAINVTEFYMGMRPGEEIKTEKFLRSLEFYSVSLGDCPTRRVICSAIWQQKGQTLGLGRRNHCRRGPYA